MKTVKITIERNQSPATVQLLDFLIQKGYSFSVEDDRSGINKKIGVAEMEPNEKSEFKIHVAPSYCPNCNPDTWARNIFLNNGIDHVCISCKYLFNPLNIRA